MITSPKFQDFLKSNPQIDLKVICKRNKHPHIKGVYLNGYEKSVPLRNCN
jgi:hypothetical protein